MKDGFSTLNSQLSTNQLSTFNKSILNMTTQFKIHSPKTTITPTLTYQQGKLKGVYFDLSENEFVTPVFFAWVIENMFDLEVGIAKMKEKGYTMEELTLEVKVPAFEEFWEVYAHKNGKKEALDRWRKLSPAEKIKAFQYIGKYHAECRQTGAFKMYAKTYLHRQVWEC